MATRRLNIFLRELPLPSRTDDYDYLHAQLSCVFLKRGTIAVFYQINRNDSSQTGYSFTSHQVGFSVGFSY